jgi:glycine betaine/proline transport system permease protein
MNTTDLQPVLVAQAASAPATDLWGTQGPAAASAAANGFLANAEPVKDVVTKIDWWHPFDKAVIPLDRWVVDALDWVVTNFRPAFQTIRVPIDATLSTVQSWLLAMPQPVMLVTIGLLALVASGPRLAIGAVLSFVAIGLIGAWPESMITLSLVITSVVFCLVIGLPLGIAAARSDRVQAVLRPVMDAMQTTPAFVYLVPVVMLFGIGNVPGVVTTIVFALPPLIRLTNLGIRGVRADLIEASRSFGASPWQMLTKVQIPLAMPTIMAGVNQTLMLALSMVVIASMIAVGGLGQMVLRGIGRLDMGLATIGGLGIVLMAIVLDRITQAFSQKRDARRSLFGFPKRKKVETPAQQAATEAA